MPELPEVEVLVRHLAPLLQEQTIQRVQVRRAKVIAPATPARFSRRLAGASFQSVARRGKFLVFTLRPARGGKPITLLGHLGMTGRMYLARPDDLEPKHAAVVFLLRKHKFIYEDTRYFGRMTLEASPLLRLGPEPLEDAFTTEQFHLALKGSRQPIKIKLLDQKLVAGVGNIYASEALHRAGLSPRKAAHTVSRVQARALWQAIRDVLREAIAWGSTVPLDWSGSGADDGLFYFGRAADAPGYYEEGLRVYDREGKACAACGRPIRRIVQAARSTFFCAGCQR